MDNISRRHFLKLSALGLGGLLLAACQAEQALTSISSPRFPVQSTTVSPSGQTVETEVVSPITPSAQYLKCNLILGRPTDTSITANLYPQTDMQVTILYGTQSGRYKYQTAPQNLKALTPQIIELFNLKPDTIYYYQVITDEEKSKEYSFHTQRAPGSDFVFTIDADPHNRDPRFDASLYAAVLSSILQDHPDFHINLGDTFMTEKVKPQTIEQAESTFIEMRPYFEIIGGQTPLFLVNGNHEGELGWLLNHENNQNLPIWSTRLRQLYYPNPIPDSFYSGSTVVSPYLESIRDSYFSWTWGNALFIVLDPFWYTTDKPKSNDLQTNWNWTLGKQQYTWLKSTLETSAARFKFIFIHHLVGGAQEARGGIEAVPYFEWGGANVDRSNGFDQYRPEWGKPIHALLVENQVSAVFHGHDHVFVKQDMDGIIYQECPQPSNAEQDNTHLASEYGYISGNVIAGSGYLRVMVSEMQAQVDFVRIHLDQNGNQIQEIGYTYSIDPQQD